MGNRIAWLRHKKGLTQAALGEKLGLSASAIGMYEQGRREPSISILISLANEILPYVNTNLTNPEIMGYIADCLPIVMNPSNISDRMLPVENEAGESFTGIIYVNGREMYRVNFARNIQELHEFINS